MALHTDVSLDEKMLLMNANTIFVVLPACRSSFNIVRYTTGYRKEGNLRFENESLDKQELSLLISLVLFAILHAGKISKPILEHPLINLLSSASWAINRSALLSSNFSFAFSGVLVPRSIDWPFCSCRN